MIKSCVIGWPISHSRSPMIHQHWLIKHKIAGSYERIAVEPENLSQFFKTFANNGFAGCNVTIPHKEEAIAHIDNVDEIVTKVGALNTVYIRSGKSHATSTDGDGFYNNLLAHVPNFKATGANVTILGAGGSAKAIIERLLRANINTITVANRTLSRAQALAQQFGPQIIAVASETLSLKNCDLLINTTSQGMSGQPTLTIDLSHLPIHATVADIVYVPLKTDLIHQAEARGNPTVTGLGMLLHQAVLGFELWFGVRPEVTTELYHLIAKDIDPDFTP